MEDNQRFLSTFFYIGEKDRNTTEYWRYFADEYYGYYYTPHEMVVSNWLPKPFALISIVCSYAMIREVLMDGDHRRRHHQGQGRRKAKIGGTPVNRMLMSMAIGDIIFSLAMLAGTWAMPPDGAYGMVGLGTVATCTLQGFTYQLGLTVSVAAASSLTVYYYLMVCRDWNDRHLEEGIEGRIQASLWLLSLVLAVYPIPLQLYNSAGIHCWIETSPPGCWDDWCVRGSNSFPHQIVLGFVIPVLFVVLGWSLMGGILCKVRKTENKMRKYAGSATTAGTGAGGPTTTPPSSSSIAAGPSFHRTSTTDSATSTVTVRRIPSNAITTSSVNRQKSKAVAMQALSYTLAFFAGYVMDFVVTLNYFFGGYNQMLDYFTYGVLFPSVGTFNFLVFARIRTMKTPEGRILKSLFFCRYCCAPLQTISASLRTRSSTLFSQQLPYPNHSSNNNHAEILITDTPECASFGCLPSVQEEEDNPLQPSSAYEGNTTHAAAKMDFGSSSSSSLSPTPQSEADEESEASSSPPPPPPPPPAADKISESTTPPLSGADEISEESFH